MINHTLATDGTLLSLSREGLMCKLVFLGSVVVGITCFGLSVLADMPAPPQQNAPQSVPLEDTLNQKESRNSNPALVSQGQRNTMPAVGMLQTPMPPPITQQHNNTDAQQALPANAQPSTVTTSQTVNSGGTPPSTPTPPPPAQVTTNTHSQSPAATAPASQPGKQDAASDNSNPQGGDTSTSDEDFLYNETE